MSEAELAKAFKSGEITRRGLIRTLMGTGASLVAATAFADALDPQAAGAATRGGGAHPKVLGLAPSSGPTSGGTSVVISGQNLAGATAVFFGSKSATILHSTATSVTVVSPKHPRGHVDVTVTTADGTSSTHHVDKFHYVHHAAPRVTGVFPADGPQSGGQTVTVTGLHFKHASAVSFGMHPATGVNVAGPETITCIVPMGVGVVDVSVTTPYGTSPNSPPDDHYTYTDFQPTPPNPECSVDCSSCDGCDFCGDCSDCGNCDCSPICTVQPERVPRSAQTRKAAARRRSASPLQPRRKG